MSKRFFQNKQVVYSLIAVAIIVLAAVFAPALAPNDPNLQSLDDMLRPPCSEFPFGTDEFGRCIFSRVLYGGRISLLTGIITTLISAVIGVFLGLIAGFNGGAVDNVIMRIVDIFLAFPGLIMALTIAGLLGASISSVVAALSLVGWMGFARVVRAKVLSEKEKEYIEAARALGASNIKIHMRHLLPAVLPPVIVLASIGVGRNILAAAGLSFLGVGVQPPTAEWGAMLSSGKLYIQSSAYLTLFPGAAIMISVLAFNFLGDGLREAMEPRLQMRKKRPRSFLRSKILCLLKKESSVPQYSVNHTIRR